MVSASLLVSPMAAHAAPATVEIKQLSLETAQKAAQAALDKCRKDGAQIAVAIVDRGGNTQVLLRDRFAGPHTVETAVNKAWTANSFKMSTAELAKETDAGKVMSGIRQISRVAAVGGGLVVQGGGVQFGGIGVSGAPGGAMDEACAQAGLKAIADDIEF
jgi:uncharacterized protein GlcG (DUF336 family)